MMELLTDGSNTDWADNYGLEFPVEEDPDMDVVRGLVPSGSFSLPNYTVLDRQLRVVEKYTFGASNALATADELLDEEIPDHSDEWPMPEDLELGDLPDVELEGDGDAPAVSGSPFSSGGVGDGTPFGGASCTSSLAGGPSASWALALGFLGLLGRRRR